MQLIPFTGNTINKGFVSVFENMVRTLLVDIERDGVLKRNSDVAAQARSQPDKDADGTCL
jgi:hypothetical protein